MLKNGKTMIFWNVDRLATSLIEDSLSENEKVNYYLALVYLQLLGSAIPAYFFGTKLDELGIFSYLICAVIATASINSILTTNNRIDEKNTIERLAILGFPAFFKATFVYWCLYFLFSVIYWVTKNMNIFLVFSYLGTPFYFWLGFYYIRKSLMKNIA